MLPRNVANFTTLNDLTSNNLQIYASGIGFTVYGIDTLIPLMSFDSTSALMTVSGDLDVAGSVTIGSISVTGSMLPLADGNAADLLDIGVFGEYVAGVKKFAGLVRDASDTLQRWTLFKGVTVKPLTTVAPLDATTFDSLRLNSIYALDGAVATPSYTFVNDVTTGMYASAVGTLNMAAAGVNVCYFTATGQTNPYPILVDSTGTSALRVQQFGSPTTGIVFNVDTTNSRIGYGYTGMYMAKEDAYNSTVNQLMYIDALVALTGKTGLRIYNSLAANGSTPSMLSLGHVLATRDTANITFSYTSTGSTSNKLQIGFEGVSADQFNIKADGSTNVTGTFTVSSTATFTSPIIIPHGSAAAPSYAFDALEASTGMYRIGANNVGISTSGVKRVDISDTLTEVSNDTSFAAGVRYKYLDYPNDVLELNNTHNIVASSYADNALPAFIVLPAAGPTHAGRTYTVIKTSSTANVTIVVLIEPTNHIDGVVGDYVPLLKQHDRVTLICNGVDGWYTM